MTTSAVGPHAPRGSPRTPELRTRQLAEVEESAFPSVFLAVVAGWGPTLRTLVLMSVPIGAVVALAIYLGPYSIGILVTLLGGESVRRVRTRRRYRRLRRSTIPHVTGLLGENSSRAGEPVPANQATLNDTRPPTILA
jgi:hypothetical protein